MNIAKNIENIAQEMLLNASWAFQKLAKPLGVNFEDRTKEIYSSKRRIVITGVGKSVIIANKIMTPLNSVGKSVGLLKPADDSKSCRGTFQHNHFIDYITKSANTLALKVLRPLYERRQSQLVAWAGEANFSLARMKPGVRTSFDFIQGTY